MSPFFFHIEAIVKPSLIIIPTSCINHWRFNWFLNYPVHLLAKEMTKLNSKFVFAYYPGDHSTVFTAEYRNNGIQFLDQKYKEWLDKTRRANK
jgi:hypothetical protein